MGAEQLKGRNRFGGRWMEGRKVACKCYGHYVALDAAYLFDCKMQGAYVSEVYLRQGGGAWSKQVQELHTICICIGYNSEWECGICSSSSVIPNLPCAV